jgi:hypothetical protein
MDYPGMSAISFVIGFPLNDIVPPGNRDRLAVAQSGAKEVQ